MSLPRIRRITLIILVMLATFYVSSTRARDWSDWIVGGGGGPDNSAAWEEWSSTTTLSLAQVSELRARDIKRRLARTHGYSAEELAKMILKKELVETLAFEEEKVRLKLQEDMQRWMAQRGIIVAIVAIIVVYCWPMIQQGYEVALVNWVVYTDRKKLEAQRCWELKTRWGMLGVILMFIIDLLQAWLTISILLSWVMRSKYFFPTPSIPIRPAQFIGGPMEKAFGGYGINIGSMLVTWGLRFAHGRIEHWTGRALLVAQKRKRQENKNNNNAVDTDTAAARQSRREERRKARQAAAAAREAAPPPDLPPSWMTPHDAHDGNGQKAEEQQQLPPTSREHEEFMQQIFETQEPTGLDELD